MKRFIPVSVFCLATLSPQVYSDELQFSDDEDEFGDFYGSEEFVSIATGTKQLINKAPAVASAKFLKP